jgi:4-amino-4-deoxy-L-arabinose transferase-like glycosyltransferase
VPGATFLFRGLIIDGSRVSNDILVAVLVTLALWLFLRWRHALSFRRGLLLGIIVGLATESKISGVYAFIPIVLVLLAGAVRGGRPVLRGAVPAGIAAAAAWAVLVVPWFVFQYRRYGDPTGASVVRSVLPHIVWIQPGNPWPAIWSAPPYVWITATLSEVPNPLQVHLAAFNFGVQKATLAVLLAGAVAVILSRRLGGLTRPERLALGLSAPLMFVLLAVLSVKAGYSFLGDARDEFPAMLPFTFIVAAPLLLSRTRLPAPVAGGVLALWSGFALLSTVILTLPWNWG